MKRTFIFLFALALALGLCLVTLTPAAANPGTTYYVSTTGSDETGTGSWYYPWKTIQHAIGQVASGDTIEVAPGTYVEVGQIIISKDLAIIGGDKATTIIKPAQDTGGSGDARGWFLVNTGYNFNLSNVTLDGSGHKVYQGVRDKGSGTIANCNINNIQYEPSGPAYAGLAMAVFGNGNVDVTGCTFTAIGRVGVLYYGTGVTGSTFSNNTYAGKGTGNWLDYGVEVGAGAIASITDNTITNCEGVASSDNSTSAGILVTDYYGPGTEATITGNTLTDNTAGIAIGYDDSDLSVATVSGNTFENNRYQIGCTANVDVDLEATLVGNTFDRAVVVRGSGIKVPTIFSRIQDAIDAASAGDTVDVYPGTYDQDEANDRDLYNGGAGTTDLNIFVDKSLTIQGVDEDGNPITDANGVQAFVVPERDTPISNLCTIFIQADNVTISGLNVTNYADPDYNFKTISVIGDNVTIKDSKLHAYDQVSCIYMYDPKYNSDTDTSYIQSYAFEDNYLDMGNEWPSGIRISSGPGWSGDVANRIISGNTFDWGSYGIEFVGPGGDSWDVYPVGAATVTANNFTGQDKGSVVAWGKYKGVVGYGDIDWDGIFNCNTFDKSVIVKTSGGAVRYYDYTGGPPNFYYVRGIYSAIQRYPIDRVAQAGDTIYVGAGTYDGTVDVDSFAGLTISGVDKTQVIIKPSTALDWNVGGYGSSRKAIFRIVDSTDVVLQNMTMDFDLIKGNLIHGILYWDSTGTVNNNVLKNMSVSDASGGYREITSYYRADGYTPENRADITISNNTFIDPGRLGACIHTYVDATIIGNTFYKTTDDFGYAIELGSESTGTISDNTIYGYDTAALSDGSQSAGIYVENCFTSGDTTQMTKDVSVTSNEVYDSQWGLYVGNEFDGYTGNVDIDLDLSDNNFHDNIVGGAVITDEDKENGSSVSISGAGNSLADNGDYGYYIYSQGDGDITVNLTGETITGQDTGVYVEDTAGESSTSSYSVSILFSNISGNPTYGVDNNVSTFDVDATGNWWGDASGPYQATTNPSGTGNAVSDHVDYSPWWGANYIGAAYPWTWYTNDCIQEAINAASAADTVNVLAGNYSESILIQKPLSVLGASANTTYIDLSGNSSGGTVVTIKNLNGNVTFTGFTVKTGPASTVDSNGIAISGLTGGTITISDNVVQCWQSASGTVEDNFGLIAGYFTSTTPKLVFTRNTVYGGGSNPVLIEKWAGPTEITNNYFDNGIKDDEASDVIFMMNYGGTTNNQRQLISGNTFDMGWGATYDNAHRGAGVSLVGSYTSGTAAGGFTNVEICNNTFVNLKPYRRGITLWNNSDNGDGGNLANVVIQGNTISNAPGYTGQFGIRILGKATGTTITQNTISSDIDEDIRIQSWNGHNATGTVVHFNSLLGGVYGLNNLVSDIVDATHNWWGAPTGPYHPSLNPGGTGSAVSDNVLFDPWFIDEEMTIPVVHTTYKFDYEVPDLFVAREEAVVPVTFETDVLGNVGYDNVRFKFSATGPGDVIFKAKDSEEHEYTFVNSGFWGPSTGFNLPADYAATTNWTLNFSEPGEYTINFALVAAPDGEVIAGIEGSQIVDVRAHDILDYYRRLHAPEDKVDTLDLLAAADAWLANTAPPGFDQPITTMQLLALADEWLAS